jgi:hypothetical protein
MPDLPAIYAVTAPAKLDQIMYLGTNFKLERSHFNHKVDNVVEPAKSENTYFVRRRECFRIVYSSFIFALPLPLWPRFLFYVRYSLLALLFSS